MFWFLLYLIVGSSLRLVMIPVILRRPPTSPSSLAWLTLIFFFPEAGVPLYLLLGANRLGRKRIRQHRQVIAQMRSEARMAGQRPHRARPKIDPVHLPVILQAEQLSGMPILGGNHVELLTDYDRVVDRLIADIDAAQHHAHLLFYIFATDATSRRVADALVRAHKRGVACRVLADAAGSRTLFSRKGLAGALNQQGVRVVPALPVNLFRRRLARIDLRNHRKLAVIDGTVAYTGSQNIINPDYGIPNCPPWFDMMGRFTGPVVNQLQTVFLEDWAFETGEDLYSPQILPELKPVGDMSAQTVPTGPSHEAETLPRVLLTAINAARRKIIITTPYLLPDEPTFLGLCMAADRGVEVNVVVPRKSDLPLVAAAARAYVEALIEGGIHIYFNEAGILHAKTMTVDDSFALLGSSNMDIRSFYLNYEINVLMYGPQITAELRFAQMRYLAESTRVDLGQWRRRPALQQYVDHAAALLSPLL